MKNMNYIKSFIRRMILLKIINLCPSKRGRAFIVKLIGVNIGRRVFIGFNCDIDPVFPELISIQDDVIISHNCSFYVHANINTNSNLKKYFPLKKNKITVGKGTFIGVGSIILKGKIGKECVLSAGSVVTKDIPDRTMVGGVPAKFIKKIK